MHAKNYRDIVIVRKHGNRLVCQQHKFLDQPVRFVIGRESDLSRQSAFVEYDVAIVIAEIYTAATPPFFAQYIGKFSRQSQRRHKRLVFIAQYFVVIQYRRNLGIGHTIIRLDDTGVYTTVDHVTVGVYFHFDCQNRSFYAGIQRTHTV